MARTAKDLLVEAVPSLEKDRDLLMEMLARPDAFTLGTLGCSVREFLERNGVEIEKDPERIRQGVIIQKLPPSMR